MRISIIVPTLNEEEFLPVLLESVKKQSFTDYEIIVADAGSTDRTAKIAKSYGAQVVPGGMPGPGRNRGAEVAQGEFLFFFDADVELEDRDFLAKALSELDERFLDVATCEFWPKSDLRLDDVMFRVTNLSMKMNESISPRAPGFCILITRRLFRRINGFDETLKLAEDHDLVQRAAEFRTFRVLKNSSIKVSIRRLEKEGRFALTQKYLQVEMHLLFKGNIRDEIVEYEFGNFGNEKDGKGILDRLESSIIDLEKAYDRQFGKNADGDTADDKTGDSAFEKLRSGFDSAVKSLGDLLKVR